MPSIDDPRSRCSPALPMAALSITREEAAYAAAQVAQAKPYALRFFTPREYATVVALSDLILPRDARSASASEAGAPEFIDYIVAEQPARQTAMRGGLVWLDSECRQRFDKAFRGLHGRRTPAGRGRHRLARPRAAGDEPRRRVLQRRCATSWPPASGQAVLAWKISATWVIGRWRSSRVPAEILKKLGVSVD